MTTKSSEKIIESIACRSVLEQWRGSKQQAKHLRGVLVQNFSLLCTGVPGTVTDLEKLKS